MMLERLVTVAEFFEFERELCTRSHMLETAYPWTQREIV